MDRNLAALMRQDARTVRVTFGAGPELRHGPLGTPTTVDPLG